MNFLRLLVQNLLGKAALAAITCEYNSVLAVAAESIEQESRCSTLKLAGTRHQYTRSVLIYFSFVSDGLHVLELEGVDALVDELLAHWGAHHVDLLLKNVHAGEGQVPSVVDGDVLELGVLLPHLFEDQKQLLGAAEGEDWHQTFAVLLLHNFVNLVGEYFLRGVR